MSADRVNRGKASSRPAESWRIGVLFSRKGHMRVPETEHFRGTALAIEELNLAGGVLGLPIEPVCYDPESSPELYRAHAERLLTEDGVSTIFGCCTSSCRKAILATVERRNALLWYSSLYEGFEYSPNVIYTGAVPNQNSLHLARYLFATYGRSFYLVGSDYIYPRESNRIMRDVVLREGGEVVAETYVPVVPHPDLLRRVVEDIRRRQPAVVFSTVVGEGAQEFYRIYREAGLDPRILPIASLTMGEGEIREIGPELCVGHITSAPYFSTIDTERNRAFVTTYRSRFGVDAPVTMYAEAAYFQVHLFADALGRARSLDTQRLADATLGTAYDAPQGRVQIDPDNNHTFLRPRIGVVNDHGAFDVVWEAKASAKPDPYLVDHVYDHA
ncbi:transporter substrate-binding domain-containing protein [Ancylobacter sp. 6x-1]|uniref:Transporter substrate-binding domain-containing protein n=1 Tax=Ancylobacter crimeensis TaxID=2579147 RepID=A0ABT0DFL6_9HYPH|nr:transporter substrate-binding domain-containing protein [Ancylobacter crimeensis]MCK0198753.1 transporter substrate-binding domain-containing protein [Ancylobacter crimeensis]